MNFDLKLKTETAILTVWNILMVRFKFQKFKTIWFWHSQTEPNGCQLVIVRTFRELYNNVLHMKFHGHYKKLQTKSSLHHICLNNLCYDVRLYDNKKMVLDGYSSDEDWEKFKWQKRNDSIDHEKTSYVAMVRKM